MRTLRLALACALGLAAAACSNGYATNGSCSQDSDCTLCTVCSCPQVYASQDTNGAACDAISQATSCPSAPESCLQGPRQAACISGHCQAIAR